MKRLCLFAGFSPKQKIEQYVVYYLKSLSETVDVYYCADNDLSAEETAKIAPFVKGVFLGKHSKYDFGSWAKIIDAVGWDFIERYDEMILTNDSCFGPICPLQPIFDKMDALDCDAWGLAKNKFLMSFFLVVKKRMFLRDDFRAFFKELKPSADKTYFVQCEKRLSGILCSGKTAAFLEKKDLKSLYKQHRREIKSALRQVIPFPLRLIMRIRTNKIRLYDNEALILPFLGFPFIKKNAFYMFNSVVPMFGLTFIQRFTDYDPRLISAVTEQYCTEQPSVSKYIRLRLNAALDQNRRHRLKSRQSVSKP